MPAPTSDPPGPWRLATYLVILGAFLTLRGYHSRDGDQAYRLVLLLNRQDPATYADDPFVRAFAAFNPHEGYLALLDLASRPLGLSAGLAILFCLMFLLTCFGVDRLARAVWPGLGDRVGLAAIALVLVARAGNIGTNHLFEAMLLDRLLALALGWVAIALAATDPARGRWASGPLIGLAAWVHSSLGLQLAMVLAAGWAAWCAWPGSTRVPHAWSLAGLATLAASVTPGAIRIAWQGGALFEGLPAEEFRLLSVTMQGPQHMVPGLWRFPQWLAWFAYLVLAGLALVRTGQPNRDELATPARARVAGLLGVVLAGLLAGWIAIEATGDLRVTLFQPFRLATLARGLALVFASGRVLDLWRRGDLTGRSRAALLVVGLSGDWAMVVAVAVEAACSIAEATLGPHSPIVAGAGLAVLAYGVYFLDRHDTASGHRPILMALGAVGAVQAAGRFRTRLAFRPRPALLAGLAWAVPVVAAVVPALPIAQTRAGRAAAEALAERWRFGEVPVGDVERLAAWCRENTPASARFVGPPGPKAFRLWSRRSLAFNRASSPYHAAGLADWADRYRDHVGFAGPTDALVRAYLADRHGLERRYQEMTDAGRAELARRQGATHVLAAAPGPGEAPPDGPLELLRVEGRYAVYRLRAVPDVAAIERRTR